MLNTSELHALSTGLNGNCTECLEKYDFPPNVVKLAIENGQVCEDGFFSSHPCILCDGPAGMRYAAHYLDENNELNHIDVCTACVEGING